ncbi:copper-(or silver)-translocating P-type ATPase [Sulfobacillus thermosulfidooxidans DSM 9293]|uniref:P-type Cu(+) transporter n=1 Tax=Sulfobacillus thermosulfidooxidans (strain DSM 9293 / VKM B-1269 / AT-1) TaxID=929705 RepID=A0A1W1WBG7_SULTA|nr:cation-translocating P-type ATPase [Sulfobacillus thermosulfidooxidans]SMC03658.1 copper-(or silver)-translocating P-type ATPase [Sulfobacillus thermosulfidooxidans DSM 9293]
MTEDTQQVQYKVGGMACSFCATSITKGLARMPGIINASVSLAHEEALIEFNPKILTDDQIRQTLLDLGYTIRDPRRVKAYEEQQKEIDWERRRLWFAGTMTALSLILMSVLWLHLVSLNIIRPFMTIVMPLFALITILGPGYYILKMAWHSLKRGILNQHVLLEFGAFSGFLGGILGLIGHAAHIPALEFPAPDFFAVATFITTYHILSGYASLLVRTKASRSVMKLLELQPAMATVIRNGLEQTVPIDDIAVGEIIRIRPGEAIPLDGRVIDGSSTVNESLVTGESLPVDKTVGTEVIGGSLNLTGSLMVLVTRVGEESFLQQIAHQIEEARAKKPGILQLVDRVLAVYVPGVLAAAALAILIWTLGDYMVSGHMDITRGIFAMLAVFVMGYPCALGMATPLAMIRGGGMAAEHGILIRGGEAFQVLKDIQWVALDKTGTLTEGRPSVTQVIPLEGTSEPYLLKIAAIAENPSEHPLSRAVVQYAEQEGLDIPTVDDFQSFPGKGLQATWEGRHLKVGSPRFLEDEGIKLDGHESQIKSLQAQGNTVVGVAENDTLLGFIAIADTIKPDALEAVNHLKKLGIKPIMLTGDNQYTARAVAQAVGINDFRAEILPSEKAHAVRELQQFGHRVMMVGDGINDAPALTQADVGVAIGAGTDIAMESADVIIMGDRLSAVPQAIMIGRNSYHKTVQNIALAFSFNGIGIPLAMTGLIGPSWAMLAMVMSVSTVLTNSFLGGKLASPPQHLISSVTSYPIKAKG